MKLRLSDAARADLDEIRLYTLERFGAGQWLIYSRAIEAAFQRFCIFQRSASRTRTFHQGAGRRFASASTIVSLNWKS
jgi:plasmid stabilization system protein ParE